MPTIEEQRNQAIAEQIQKMAGIDAPLPRAEKAEQPKLSEKEPATASSSTDIEAYLKIFLQPCVIENRASFSLNRDTLDLLRHILHDLRSKTTLSAYIENVLREHIGRHKETIGKAIEKNRKKSIIL